MKGFDYDSYSLEQLRDIERKIDKEAHPERYAKLRTILDDPARREKLEKEHVLILSERKIKAEDEKASFGAIIIWIYGFIVLVTGTMYFRYASIYIESWPIRILIPAVLFYVGYKALINRPRSK